MQGMLELKKSNQKQRKLIGHFICKWNRAIAFAFKDRFQTMLLFTAPGIRIKTIESVVQRRGVHMKALLKLGAGVALGLMGIASAFAQTTVPYAGTYYDTVTGQSCLGGGATCTFTFAPVPVLNSVSGGSGNVDAILTVSRVNCRIFTNNVSPGTLTPLVDAELGKASNTAKVFFLSNSASLAGPNFTLNLIDQTTQFYVGPGISPTIIVGVDKAGLAAIINTPPTCSVSGLIQ